MNNEKINFLLALLKLVNDTDGNSRKEIINELKKELSVSLTKN